MQIDDYEAPPPEDETAPLLSTTGLRPVLAPVEKVYTRPPDFLICSFNCLQADVLGREVTLVSATMLNIGQIIGSGIYAVPGVILNSVGSIALLLAFWVLAPIFAFAGLAIYSELASMFPHRSGAEVVYLEQAYPKPRFLISTAFAVTAVLTSFSASNALVFAQYTLSAFDIPITPRSQTTLAVAMVIVTVGSVAISTKWSLRASNFFTFFKISSLVLIVATGMAVLTGLTRIENPWANFHEPFEGTSWNANALATAFVKSNHAFVGYHNAFNVLGEVRGKNPVRTVRKAGFISLFLVSVLFLFINVAYIAAVPREEIRNSGQLVAVLFFREVFGSTGARIFPLLVACSCFGNIIAVTIGQARIIREVARQGLLPYPAFFTSVKPFGTPLAPVALKGFLTILVIVALPAKDAFNFVVDLASYPNLVFHCAMAFGIWILRKRRQDEGVEPANFQARNIVIILYLASCTLLLVLPWYAKPGHADVSFWYATYCVAGIVLLLLCGLYYWLWIIVLPKFWGYEIVQEVEEHPDGARNTRLVRRYKAARVEEE
ncbi:amino acid transporter [Gymnopilus junonius]|uniref:Amino acid transporter n=1 Tax=Gymnopilus junonius TaxID=109634 RepID=A0A9P5NSM8_GYMJU|nr:amino acid transporter [Gymnopilus junonius]